jgi:hypothetical protein
MTAYVKLLSMQIAYMHTYIHAYTLYNRLKRLTMIPTFYLFFVRAARNSLGSRGPAKHLLPYYDTYTATSKMVQNKLWSVSCNSWDTKGGSET